MSAAKNAKKQPAKPATKAPRRATEVAEQEPEAVDQRAAERQAEPTSEPSATEARASAITDPNAEIASSEDAAAARKAEPARAKTAEKVDEAKPAAFPPNPFPANPAAVENEMVKESRLRARLVGESARAAANPSAGKPGAVETRRVQKLGYTSGVFAGSLLRASGKDTEAPEDDEVIVRGMDGFSEVGFRAHGSGGVEIFSQPADAVNNIRGGGVTTLAIVAPDALAEVASIFSGAALSSETEAQSASEQRSGAGEGDDPGPVAPRPVEL